MFVHLKNNDEHWGHRSTVGRCIRNAEIWVRFPVAPPIKIVSSITIPYLSTDLNMVFKSPFAKGIKMKKTLTLVSVLGFALALLTGCGTTGITPTQINAAAGLLKTGSTIGASYAIQQNTNNVKWFELADTTIDTFVLGTDLSPLAFENALNAVSPQLQNQWIQLALDGVIVAYDSTYSQYVISNVNSNAVAKQFLTAIADGFDVAITNASPGTVTMKVGAVKAKVARPSVIAPKAKK